MNIKAYNNNINKHINALHYELVTKATLFPRILLQHHRPLFFTVCDIEIHSLETTLILQPARSVKTGSTRAQCAHGNRL